MSASVSVIPGLEEAIEHGSPERRTQMVRRIAVLFAESAAHFNEDHVGLFDDVLGRFVSQIDAAARAELSSRFAPIANAPPALMRRLAADDDAAVAAPVIAQSQRLRAQDLIDIARTKSSVHLSAVAGRDGIGESVTEVVVERGDAAALRRVADNTSARFSVAAFSALVRRGGSDEELAEAVSRRADLPGHLFRDLLVRAPAEMQQRLLAAATPETKAALQRVLDKVSKELSRPVPVRDFTTAQRTVLEQQQAGKLGEPELLAFAEQRRYEETVVTLSLLCGVPVDVTERLMSCDRPDPVLILCRAAGYNWPTVRAVIGAQAGVRGLSAQAIEDAFGNFEKLPVSTAQRVVRFWQVREPDNAA